MVNKTTDWHSNSAHQKNSYPHLNVQKVEDRESSEVVPKATHTQTN